MGLSYNSWKRGTTKVQYAERNWIWRNLKTGRIVCIFSNESLVPYCWRCLGMSIKLCTTLKKRVNWFLDLLDSSDSQCCWSIIDETLLVFLKRLVVYRAARICTISIKCIWYLWWGLHTVKQYSRLDLTILKHAFALVSSLQDLRFRRRKPNILFDFLEMILSMWVFQESDDCMSTPRYFVDSCDSRTYGSTEGTCEKNTSFPRHRISFPRHNYLVPTT